MSSALEATRGAAALAVLTEWPEFTRVKPDTVAPLMSGREVVDGRNLLDRAVWSAAGFSHHGIGR